MLKEARAALAPLRQKQELETRQKLIRNDERRQALESQKLSEQAAETAVLTDTVLSHIQLADRLRQDLRDRTLSWVKDWRSGNQTTKELGR